MVAAIEAEHAAARDRGGGLPLPAGGRGRGADRRRRQPLPDRARRGHPHPPHRSRRRAPADRAARGVQGAGATRRPSSAGWRSSPPRPRSTTATSCRSSSTPSATASPSARSATPGAACGARGASSPCSEPRRKSIPVSDFSRTPAVSRSDTCRCRGNSHDRSAMSRPVARRGSGCHPSCHPTRQRRGAESSRMTAIDMRTATASSASDASSGGSITASCLLDTHHHAIVETSEPNLGEGLRRILGGHSRWLNAGVSARRAYSGRTAGRGGSRTKAGSSARRSTSCSIPSPPGSAAPDASGRGARTTRLRTATRDAMRRASCASYRCSEIRLARHASVRRRSSTRPSS